MFAVLRNNALINTEMCSPRPLCFLIFLLKYTISGRILLYNMVYQNFHLEPCRQNVVDVVFSIEFYIILNYLGHLVRTGPTHAFRHLKNPDDSIASKY